MVISTRPCAFADATMLGAPSYRHAKAVPPDTTYDIIKQWWRSDDREAAAARQFVETGRGVCFVYLSGRDQVLTCAAGGAVGVQPCTARGQLGTASLWCYAA